MNYTEEEKASACCPCFSCFWHHVQRRTSCMLITADIHEFILWVVCQKCEQLVHDGLCSCLFWFSIIGKVMLSDEILWPISFAPTFLPLLTWGLRGGGMRDSSIVLRIVTKVQTHTRLGLILSSGLDCCFFYPARTWIKFIRILLSFVSTNHLHHDYMKIIPPPPAFPAFYTDKQCR